MERRLLTIRGFAIGILAGLVLASAGVAGARQGGLEPSPEAVSLVSDEQPKPSTDCSDEAEPSDELPDLTSEGDQPDDSDEGEECPPAEEDEEAEEDEPQPATESGDRQAQCEDAAGLSDDEPELTSNEGEDGSEQKLKGLDNAIQHVLANCIKNPQAPGLLNALRRLAENRERKMARDEVKAERKAAHAAGKSRGKGPKT